MISPLTRDQRWARARLRTLLTRRAALDVRIGAYGLGGTPDAGRIRAPAPEPWQVHALDAAIVSAYRLACQLDLGDWATASLRAYRLGRLGSPPEAPRGRDAVVPPASPGPAAPVRQGGETWALHDRS
jgi:hypothetical protein